LRIKWLQKSIFKNITLSKGNKIDKNKIKNKSKDKNNKVKTFLLHIHLG